MNMAYVYANAMKDVIILNANTCRILCFYLIKKIRLSRFFV